MNTLAWQLPSIMPRRIVSFCSLLRHKVQRMKPPPCTPPDSKCVQTGSAAKCWFCQQQFTSRTNTYPLKSKAVNLNSKGSHGTESFNCLHLTLWTCSESPRLLFSPSLKQHLPTGVWALLNSPLGIQRCLCTKAHRLSANGHMPVI